MSFLAGSSSKIDFFRYFAAVLCSLNQESGARSQEEKNNITAEGAENAEKELTTELHGKSRISLTADKRRLSGFPGSFTTSC